MGSAPPPVSLFLHVRHVNGSSSFSLFCFYFILFLIIYFCMYVFFFFGLCLHLVSFIILVCLKFVAWWCGKCTHTFTACLAPLLIANRLLYVNPSAGGALGSTHHPAAGRFHCWSCADVTQASTRGRISIRSFPWLTPNAPSPIPETLNPQRLGRLKLMISSLVFGDWGFKQDIRIQSCPLS